MKKAKVIAEIGCNHMGDPALAKEFISIAKYYCKADAVKFQKRDVETWAQRYPQMYDGPHPNPANAYGSTYKAHREALELNISQHEILKDYCDEIGITYSSSVWDLISAKEIAALQPEFIKIPSACNTNTEMLDWLCDNYEGEIHISTGMTTRQELDHIAELFQEKGRLGSLVIYNCTSGYPVPYKDVCLLELKKLQDRYGEKVKAIGFSGHHIGTAVDIAAFTLGASVIERHYTLDKTWKGTDHAASLEPEELKQLVTGLDAAAQALQYKSEEILDIEEVQRKKLKW